MHLASFLGSALDLGHGPKDRNGRVLAMSTRLASLGVSSHWGHGVEKSSLKTKLVGANNLNHKFGLASLSRVVRLRA